MSSEIETEIKYLLKYFPKDLINCKSKKLIDIYIPKKNGHAAIRIRQQGDKFFITKKTPIGDNQLKEETIAISEEEFNVFKTLETPLRIDKTRYYYPIKEGLMEIDVFNDKLKGLALAEIEFSSLEELNKFKMPDFCLANVSNEDFLAGGVLCSKSFSDLKPVLEKFNYKEIK